MQFAKKLSETEVLFEDLLIKIKDSDPEYFRKFNDEFTKITQESVTTFKAWRKASKVADIMRKFIELESSLEKCLMNSPSEFKTSFTSIIHNDFLSFVSEYANKTEIWRSIYFNEIVMKIENS